MNLVMTFHCCEDNTLGLTLQDQNAHVFDSWHVDTEKFFSAIECLAAADCMSLQTAIYMRWMISSAFAITKRDAEVPAAPCDLTYRG